MEDDTSDGGSTFGGISFTLNPIDFSGIFGGNNDNDTLEDDSGNIGNNGDMEESEEIEEADSGVDDDKEENDASDGFKGSYILLFVCLPRVHLLVKGR